MTDIFITAILVAIAILTIVLAHLSNNIRSVKADVEFVMKNAKESNNTQMQINNDLLSFNDRILGRFGDLNTRVIELEARTPEEKPLFTDVEDEDIVI